MKTIYMTVASIVITTFWAGVVNADENAAALEMARKAQDPLGNVRALMTDNTIAFDGGPEDDTSYGFQFQPVYAIPSNTSWNMLARAVIPVVGVESDVVIPPLGPEQRPSGGSDWGISDTMLQYFFSPKSDGGTKWGIGPQVSLRTRTSERQAGPGWGAGIAAVVFSGVGNWALGAIGMQHWGQDDYSVGTVQLIAMYNMQSKPGTYIGYNNSLTYNWEADSNNKLTLPLGLTFGRTMPLSGGAGLDLNVGAYHLTERPENAPQWQLKFGISYYWP